MQVRGRPGDAFQGKERQRRLPLVPVPELRALVQMEVQHLDMVQFPLSAFLRNT